MGTDTPQPGGQYTHQLMRGFVIVAVSMAAAYAFAPYADSVAAQSAHYLSFALLVVVAYGLYLMATSPLLIELMERAEVAVADWRTTEK